jgi:DNA recombination protein RmuC
VNTFLTLLSFLSVGAAVYAFSEARRWRAAASEARAENERQRCALDSAKERMASAEATALRAREVADVQVKMLTQTQQQLDEKFRALASEALQTNSQLFLDRSREQVRSVVEPVSQTLRQFEEHVRKLESDRAGAYQGLTTQVSALVQLQERVRQSADDLKNALRSPSQRGRWGELQLRRVVELAGMLEHCDFAEQKTLFGDINQRPDLIVNLPNQCQVIVDSKVSLEAYLRAIETTDETERLRHFADHARQVRTHVKSLGEKAYWERLPGSPDFVVAFLPLESLFSAALDQDPALLEMAMQRRVVIATPTTLITLLLTVAHGWRQHSLSESAEKIRSLGTELYTRVLTMSEHFEKLGESIGRTVNAYNTTVGSLERNVLSSARKFKELRPANSKQLEELDQVDSAPRGLDASKWIA